MRARHRLQSLPPPPKKSPCAIYPPYRYFLLPCELTFGGALDGVTLPIPHTTGILNMRMTHGVDLAAATQAFAHYAAEDFREFDMDKAAERYWRWLRVNRATLDKVLPKHKPLTFLGEGEIELERLITKLAYIRRGDRVVLEGSRRSTLYFGQVTHDGIHCSPESGNHLKVRPVAKAYVAWSTRAVNLDTYLTLKSFMRSDYPSSLDPWKSYASLDELWETEIRESAEEG